jgi:hypothetical protein
MESNHQLNWNITLSDVPTFSNVLAIQRRPEFRRPNEFCHSVEGNRHTLLSALGLPLVSFPTARMHGRRDSRRKQWRDLFSVVCRSTDTPLPMMWRLRRIVGRTVRTRAASKGLLDGSSHCLLALTELVTMGRQVAWFTLCDGEDNATMCKIHHTEAFIVCGCRRVSQAHEFDAFEAFEPAKMFIVLSSSVALPPRKGVQV